MRSTFLSAKDFLWTVPASLASGAILASMEDGAWWVGWLGFSALFLAGSCVLIAATRWANPVNKLAVIVALAFLLRFAGGVATYLILPVHGYDDEDDRAVLPLI